MKKLQLPITIRIPERNEVPKANLERLEQSLNANIMEGYRLSKVGDETSKFKFYAQVNIDNSRLWDLFKELSEMLPEPISLLFGWKDDEVHYGEYIDSDVVWKVITPLETEIVQDGFLQIGLIHSTPEELIEVFISEAKYIRFWASDILAFQIVMNHFELSEIEGLEFMDEYPRVTERLHQFNKKVKETSEVIMLLREEFS